eukprot:s2571_g7.t1
MTETARVGMVCACLSWIKQESWLAAGRAAPMLTTESAKPGNMTQLRAPKRILENDKRVRSIHFIAEAPLRPEAITVQQISCLRH